MYVFGLELIAAEWYQQVAVLAILTIALLMFMRDYWRYDVVAILVMLGVVAVGALPYENALANFGHPAVVIVASMFIMSRALVQSGLVDALVSRLGFLQSHPIVALTILVVLVAFLSGFINNVGALAMVMPVAIHLARLSGTSIALFLLPLAFASHLGGFMTLIGTPRNLLVSDMRLQATGEGFAMFDFLPVGGVLAFLGVLFLVLVAWRLLPQRKVESVTTIPEREYTTEVVVPAEKTRIFKYTAADLRRLSRDSVTFARLLRNEKEKKITSESVFAPDDHIIIRGSAAALTQFIEKYNLQLSGLRSREWHVTNADDNTTVEAIVPPYASLVGKSWQTLSLPERFGTNFIALARQGFTPLWPLERINLRGGDVLLLRGRIESIKDTMAAVGLLSINTYSGDEIGLGRTRTIFATISVIVLAIALAAFNVVPLALIFLIAAVLLIIFDLVSLRQAYQSIDVSVLILLAGMITLGDALLASGVAATLANTMLVLGDMVGPVLLLVVVLVLSMFLSDFMNTTASVVIMGPIAVTVALSLGVSIDPFLMVVAIGASCAFLTPVGHESNAIVMQKGGYNFRDYMRIGLPLEILIVLVTVPLVLAVWPLYL